MRNIIIVLSISVFLVGCGSTKTSESEIPIQEDPLINVVYESDYENRDQGGYSDFDSDKPDGSSVESVASTGGTQLKSGSFTLPCGMELSYSDYVRNDVTGKWRISLTASGYPVSDYAKEYYDTMFSNDSEIHAVVNFTLNTTTCIKVINGIIFVDTYEYVKGEEHDASLLFTGMHLTSNMYEVNTGEEMDFGE